MLVLPGQSRVSNAVEKLAAIEGLKRRDPHVHTSYCLHATGTMEDYVRAAMDRGLEEVGFLAHAEVGIRNHRRLWLNTEDFDPYRQEGLRLKEKYAGRITVSLGLEVGLNPARIPDLKALVEKHPWDRIGLAYHHIPDGDRHLTITSRAARPRLETMDSLSVVRHYYEILLEHIAVFKPDMVCHLDVVRRHVGDESDRPDVRALVKSVLEEMRRHGAALEINTSGYTHNLASCYPAPWIIASAWRMGIPLVLSSDSHAPDQIGRYFGRAVSAVYDAIGTGNRPTRRTADSPG